MVKDNYLGNQVSIARPRTYKEIYATLFLSLPIG